MAGGPCVTILMGTWNGAAVLPAQLDSLAAQSHADWRLVVSDDGSTDATPAVVGAFAARFAPGRVQGAEGPRQGFAANYLSMLRALPEAPGWLAFSDQDDVWLPDRLARGIAALERLPAGRPALYCSRTWITSEALEGRRLSAPRPRPPSFRNALVQNIAAGNTILLNPAAAALLGASARRVAAVVAHDWWAYLIVAGAGGAIVHDDAPTVLYRQHGGNRIGANDGWSDRLRRLGMVLRGVFAGWNEVNAAALDACADLLSPEARLLLANWQEMRSTRGAARRLSRLSRLRLYRQSAASTAVLWLSAALGKV